MFCKVIFLVYFLRLMSLISGASLEKLVTKRSDIDLQTCIENFDVHKDKIIRTQDSRDMGAKYLNEIDLGSREECLRLCCETENCDVFVFEEKNSGSCYLFQCGPPEDFKCKFTHHVNYSSAVLAVNRHLPDLESQIKLTKHEKDLTKLRKPETDPEINPLTHDSKTTITSTISTAKPKEVLPVTAPKSATDGNKERKCSRYQFECRSTGECIAIYNACDGIPQCTDGSDEAPELGCPEIPTTVLPPPVPPINQIHETGHTPNLIRPPLLSSSIPSQKLYQPSPIQERTNGQIQGIPNQDADFLRPLTEPRNPLIPQPPLYDSPQISQYPQLPPQTPNNWRPHQYNQMSQDLPQYPDRNSHIFNHKENGLQVSEGETSQVQYGEVNSHEYPKVMPNYYGEVYRQQIPPIAENWPKNMQDDPRFNGDGKAGPFDPEVNANPRDSWQQQNSKPLGLQDVNSKHNYNIESRTTQWKPEKPESHHDHEHEKMAHELKHSKEIMQPVKTAEIKSPKIEKLKPQQNAYPNAAEFKMEGAMDLQDGVSETPGGAILSLTLGMIVTCIMALLIGCRLRVVRRRMRRGGKSYAHDADYLVNGMYL